jgi:hypothetical protein
MTPKLAITNEVFTPNGRIAIELRVGGEGSASKVGGGGIVTPQVAAAWLRRAAASIEAVSEEMYANRVAKTADDERIHLVVTSDRTGAYLWARTYLDAPRRNVVPITPRVVKNGGMGHLRGLDAKRVLVHVLDAELFKLARPMLTEWAATTGSTVENGINRGNAHRLSIVDKMERPTDG